MAGRTEGPFCPIVVARVQTLTGFPVEAATAVQRDDGGKRAIAKRAEKLGRERDRSRRKRYRLGRRRKGQQQGHSQASADRSGQPARVPGHHPVHRQHTPNAATLRPSIEGFDADTIVVWHRPSLLLQRDNAVVDRHRENLVLGECAVHGLPVIPSMHVVDQGFGHFDERAASAEAPLPAAPV